MFTYTAQHCGKNHLSADLEQHAIFFVIILYKPQNYNAGDDEMKPVTIKIINDLETVTLSGVVSPSEISRRLIQHQFFQLLHEHPDMPRMVAYQEVAKMFGMHKGSVRRIVTNIS